MLRKEIDKNDVKSSSSSSSSSLSSSSLYNVFNSRLIKYLPILIVLWDILLSIVIIMKIPCKYTNNTIMIIVTILMITILTILYYNDRY